MAPAAPDPRSPVIVGVGQHLVHDGDAPEPAEMMAEAARLAGRDTGRETLLSGVEVIAAVPTFSWRYNDPGRIVAERIGAGDARTWYATVGGNTPQMLVNRLAGEIAAGRCDLGIVCGGESVRTRQAAKRAGTDVGWPRQGDDVVPDWHDGGDFMFAHPAEVALGIVMPTQAYPLFENALWHDSGRSLEEHLAVIGEMWAGFSRVAAANPYAFRRTGYTAAEITTPSEENRLVGFPYTKRMVSNPDVDMSSALVMCSVQRARELGIPADRWVFLHAGTDGTDRRMSERPDFVSSDSIGVAGRRVLELAGVGIDDVAHLDLYSCFPSAVQLALRELDIPIDRQLTVYGGLSFAGGPWNNPVGHAIASMVGVLRSDPGSRGLVTANGGNVDKHAFGVYSTEPPAAGFRHERPQHRIDARGGREVDAEHRGAATIETWTVMHERDGNPARAHAACLTATGARTWAVSSDPDVMKLFTSEDVVGRPVEIGEGSELRLVSSG